MDRMAITEISLRSRQHEALVHTAVLRYRTETTVMHNSKVVRYLRQNSRLPTTLEFRSSLVAAQSLKNNSKLISRGRNRRSAKAGSAGSFPRARNEIAQISITKRRQTGRRKYYGVFVFWVSAFGVRSLCACAHCGRINDGARCLPDRDKSKKHTIWRYG